MTNPKTKKKKVNKAAKIKANAKRCSKILKDTAHLKTMNLLKHSELSARPASGLLGKHHKYRLTEIGSDVGLGVSDDLKFCNGIIGYGRCSPFPINITLVLE